MVLEVEDPSRNANVAGQLVNAPEDREKMGSGRKKSSTRTKHRKRKNVKEFSGAGAVAGMMLPLGMSPGDTRRDPEE